MPTQCFKPLKGRRFRITRLDDCGEPVIGPTSVVSHGFIKVGGSFDYNDGEEFFQTDAWGDVCLNELDCPVLKRVNLDVDLCTVDPDQADIVHGARQITSGGNAIGYFGEAEQICNGFALEVWQKASGALCAAGVETWVYWLFPWVTNAKMKDFEIANSRSEFGFEATTNGAGNQAGTLGPFDTLPVGNPLVVTDHFAVFLTTIAPPAEVCGAVAYV